MGQRKVTKNSFYAENIDHDLNIIFLHILSHH